MDDITQRVLAWNKPSVAERLLPFLAEYASLCRSIGIAPEPYIQTYLKLIQDELDAPTSFSHFHLFERAPFDFYTFGLDFLRPLIDQARSCVLGQEHVTGIIDALNRQENVILLANHQTEIDPQIISILLEPFSKRLASSMIFVAGHRVTSDPMAVPFSRGRNLLCIYSKKYIDEPPQERSTKLLHNSKTMAELQQLLHEGGVCVYVAPSGGRDRFDSEGQVLIDPFDAQSVEMFVLLAAKAKQPTHLQVLALATQHIMPPPRGVHKAIGEAREIARGPAGLAFGPPIDIEVLSTNEDRKERRVERAQQLSCIVDTMHSQLVQHILSH